MKKELMHDASGPQVSSHNLKTGVYDSYETDESGFLIHTAADFERTDHFNEAVGLYELLFVAEKDDDNVVWQSASVLQNGQRLTGDSVRTKKWASAFSGGAMKPCMRTLFPASDLSLSEKVSPRTETPEYISGKASCGRSAARAADEARE